MRDWFCKLCKLQFDKKVVFDLHQKLVHGIDSLRLIRIKDKKTQMCTKNSIITNKSTIFERKNKNNMHDIWLPSHDEHATATCATATRDITEVSESNAIGSSTKVSESCYTTSTNLEIENFVSSISFDDEKNLDIKVELKHDPNITSTSHEYKFDTKPSFEIFDQQIQNVKDNPPSNDLSRIEKMARMKTHSDLSNSPSREAPFTTSIETSSERQDVETNAFFSRIEVIQKLASMKIDFDLSKSLTDLQNLLRENLIKKKCQEPKTDPQSPRSSLALKMNPDQTRQINIESESDMSFMSSKMVSKSTSVPSVNSSISKKYTEDQYYLEMVEKRDRDTLGCPLESKNEGKGKAHPETFKEIDNLTRNEVVEKLVSLKIPFDMRKNLPYLKLRLYNRGLRVNQGLQVNHYSKKKVQGIAMKRNVSNSEETLDLDERDSTPDQNRQNVETNLPCDNLSRIEKLERMDLSNIPTNKAPLVPSMEYSGQSPNETKDLSKIEVIEKLASMKINFDMSRSLTDLQNLLRENLIKLFKSKEPVTTASQSTGSLLKSKDSESSLVSKCSELDIPETFKQIDNLSRNEVVEKLASLKIPFDLRKSLPYLKLLLYDRGLRVNQGLRVNHYSKKKVQGIAMKRNVLNSEETINLDQSDVAKRSRMDEDITCEKCSQAFWYKSQLYEHLEKEHAINDAEKYVKSREDKKKMKHGLLKHLEKECNTPLRYELLCQLFRASR